MKKLTTLFCGTTALALTSAVLTAGVAIAQEDGIEDAEKRENVIVVTAQKREQSITEVPISIQAFGEEDLVKSSIRDINEIINLVPGASEGENLTSGLRTYQIRGISKGPSQLPTVGYYIDNSAIVQNTAQTAAPIGRAFDLERVEVLRGPQSTLYGNGSMGGTVRFITNKPNLEEFEGIVQGGYSSTDGGEDNYFVDGAVSLPVVKDKFAVRLTASYEETGGYIEDPLGAEDVDDGDVLNLRAKALWQVNEDLALDFMYVKNQADQTRGSLLSSTEPPLSISFDDGNFFEIGYDLFAGNVDYTIGDVAQLTSTTTFIEGTNLGANSAFGTVSTGQQDFETINNETRLVSTGDGDLQWLVGVFYSESSFDFVSEQTSPLGSFSFVGDASSEEISIFGEVSYSLMDGKLVPLFGLRYFEDQRDFNLGFVTDGKFDSVNPRFNLSYLPNDDSQYFINIAKGFRSGQFNNSAICGLVDTVPGFQGSCLPLLDPDDLWSYELGTKQVLFGGQLLADASIYYQDWSNYSGSITAAPFLTYFGSISDVESRGIDIGLVYQPDALEGFSLQATANVNSTEFTNVPTAISGVTGVDEGDRIPLVPEWTAAITANYERPINETWNWVSTASYSHLAEQAGQLGLNVPDGGPRDLLRIRFGAENESFGVYFVGNNLMNEDDPISVTGFGPGINLFTRDRPQTLGVEAKAKF